MTSSTCLQLPVICSKGRIRAIDRLGLYSIIYALAARGGCEDALFGESAALGREAFERSLAGDAFPELWFEVPLAGDPWFDLHALTSHDDLNPDDFFAPDLTGGHPEVFEWFARQERAVRQLALSWDIGSGAFGDPAVQLLLWGDAPDLTCGFLEAAGRADAMGAYRAFHGRIPQGWFACYAGAFPGRLGRNVRVECIPNRELQRAYADDAALVEEHLRRVGLGEAAAIAAPRCQLLASAPFQFEFQFDVDERGMAASTFGASARFASPADAGAWEPFDVDGAAGELMRQVEAWGLADGRWRQLAGTAFAQRVTRGDESCVIYCYPAFLKLRWRDGAPLDAKVYLIAGVQ